MLSAKRIPFNAIGQHRRYQILDTEFKTHEKESPRKARFWADILNRLYFLS